LPSLGELSFYGDEDYTALAVRSILENGIPSMPSGMNYWRGMPYSYTAAAAAVLFGVNEMSLRLPSAVFGMIAVPVFYLLAKRLIGLIPAVVASSLLVFSSWHIDMSREARMYSMFLTFFLMTTWFFVLGYFCEKKPFKILAFIAALVTISLHASGILIVVIWGISLIRKPVQVRSRTSLLIVTAALGPFFWGYRELSTLPHSYTVGSLGLVRWARDLLYLKVIPSANLLSHIIEHHAYIFWPITIGIIVVTGYL
ncbi:MAG: phospholipid carrier-dependent glycosyltransferase, partial [Candidatus Aenigmarchaeota archaeon]|nr:phospholipid carrier-dependent glycosyltransferase [Candidatus Aenigmarchaeota archaeon]